MHETIDEFFEYVRQEGLSLAELEEEQITKIVSEIIENNLKMSKIIFLQLLQNIKF